jgi:DNA-binding NtrC family response regulator
MAQCSASPWCADNPATVEQADFPGGTFRRRTVLLVDDDADVLALLGETMTALGHRVITAQDGRAALKCLLKYRSIDCLFSDVVMPNGMTGLQLMTAARAVRPGLPALLASSYPREIVSSLGEIPDNVEFIAKPYALSDLFSLLDSQVGPPEVVRAGVAA